jgi:hypothetical protein
MAPHYAAENHIAIRRSSFDSAVGRLIARLGGSQMLHGQARAKAQDAPDKPSQDRPASRHSEGVPNVTVGTLIILTSIAVTFALIFGKIAKI